MADKTISPLVDDLTNVTLMAIPFLNEIKAGVFNLNKGSASRPDGFGAFFYQTFWDIIKNDVSYAVIEFFK